MKLIIAGSRDFTNISFVKDRIERSVRNVFDKKSITEVVSGGAKGVDAAGEEWAMFNSIGVAKFEVSQQEWETLGKKAGPLRNQKMAEYADALLCIWDGQSRGSANMVKEAKSRGLVVHSLVLSSIESAQARGLISKGNV